MGDFILAHRSVVKNEYQKLADVIVSGSAVTQIDLTSLNLVKGEEYVLVSDIVNASGSSSQYRLFVNGNYTTTNYYVQELYVGSTAYSGSRSNTNYISFVDNGNKSCALTKIKLTNNGYIVYQSYIEINYGGSGIAIDNAYSTSTFTSTSITSLRIASSVANAIGIGSRIQLYKLGGV